MLGNPKVNELIANVKKVFLKAPLRVKVFQEVAPNLRLPPEPGLIRWGTWVDAAMYYALNPDEVALLLERFEGSEAKSIGISKELVTDPEVASQLAFIASNFSKLAESITKLECSAQTLATTL